MYIKASILFLLLALFAMPNPLIGRATIIVNDQNAFDRLDNCLAEAIKSGDNEVYVYIYPGTFVAKENHLRVQGMNYPDVKICIFGNGTIIVPDGHDYNDGDQYIGALSAHNSWLYNSQEIKTWSDVLYADGFVEIMDTLSKQCRIKSREPLTLIAKGATHILIPHWYQSSIYKVEKITGNYVYFTASDLKKSRFNGYSVNDDYNYGKKNIRFKLLNSKGNKECLRIIDGRVYLPSRFTSVREGVVHRFFAFLDSNFHSVEISGINFWGSCYADYNSVIRFNNVLSHKIWIHDCEFQGMRNSVISVSSTPNVVIEKNLFANCYSNGIQSDNTSMNTIVRSNRFIRMGLGMNNSFCIVCQGNNFLISNNKMVDFGYGGIAVGVWYKSTKDYPCKGIIEDNELTFTDAYLSNIANYGIMDSGAIYLWTKNDGVIIQNNYINGYAGMGDNRGIFCDDGAYNFQIYGNIITRIMNSYCIDSRRVATVEKSKTSETGIERANINILIKENLVDGPVRFVAHEGENNGCVKMTNYILMKKEGKTPKNTIKNIVSPEEDILLEYVGSTNGKFYVTSHCYRRLKKSNSWNYLRKYVGKI